MSRRLTQAKKHAPPPTPDFEYTRALITERRKECHGMKIHASKTGWMIACVIATLSAQAQTNATQRSPKDSSLQKLKP
jgi:hypothetical protein